MDYVKAFVVGGIICAIVQILMEKIDFYLQNRCGTRMLTGAVIFSNVFGELGRTKDADKILQYLDIPLIPNEWIDLYEVNGDKTLEIYTTKFFA